MKVPTIEWKQIEPNNIKFSNIELSTIQKKKELKQKFNTFLVFHSGKFIMSGMKEETMRDDYYRFLNILKQNELKIKEVLEMS